MWFLIANFLLFIHFDVIYFNFQVPEDEEEPVALIEPAARIRIENDFVSEDAAKEREKVESFSCKCQLVVGASAKGCCSQFSTDEIMQARLNFACNTPGEILRREADSNTDLFYLFCETWSSTLRVMRILIHNVFNNHHSCFCLFIIINIIKIKFSNRTNKIRVLHFIMSV